MNRIAYIEIAGKSYPMSFSLMASKKLVGKSGILERLSSVEEKDLEEQDIDTITDILELLISQGCAYKNYFEKDVPIEDKDPVIDGKWTPLPREALEVAIGIGDMETLMDKIQECMGNGQKKEIEAIPTKQRKNAEAKRE